MDTINMSAVDMVFKKTFNTMLEYMLSVETVNKDQMLDECFNREYIFTGSEIYLFLNKFHGLGASLIVENYIREMLDTEIRMVETEPERVANILAYIIGELIIKRIDFVKHGRSFYDLHEEYLMEVDNINSNSTRPRLDSKTIADALVGAEIYSDLCNVDLSEVNRELIGLRGY